MEKLTSVIAGFLFGAGLTISGMVNPMKVQNFLDLFGTWDPTLLFVFGSALAVTLAGYALELRQPKPLFAKRFYLPDTTGVDAHLMGGAIIFGVGWGLSGYCPAPGIASLAFGHIESFVFVAAMAIGMALAPNLLNFDQHVTDG
jgi:uncharacterized membrane protein YedE/YeeE